VSASCKVRPTLRAVDDVLYTTYYYHSYRPASFQLGRSVNYLRISAVPRDFKASTIIVGGVLTSFVFIDLRGFRTRNSDGRILPT
jgi:hypothetical protein